MGRATYHTPALTQSRLAAQHPLGTEAREAMELRGRLLLHVQRLTSRWAAMTCVDLAAASSKERQDVMDLRHALDGDLMELRDGLSTACTVQELRQVEQVRACTHEAWRSVPGSARVSRERAGALPPSCVQQLQAGPAGGAYDHTFCVRVRVW